MTPTRLDAARLEEIGERAGKATEGPWISGGPYTGSVWKPGQSSWILGDGRPCDADFAAGARTDIPALLGHIAAVEAEVAQLRAQVAEGRRC